MGLEIYFFWDERTDNYDIQIKGISDDKLYLHEAFISIICDILRNVQKQDIQSAMIMISQIRGKYDSGELPMECYREFNSSSCYRLKGMDYGVIDLTQDEMLSLLPHIDKSYNCAFLLELHKILMEMMFTR
jgi:hypothetical protein